MEKQTPDPNIMPMIDILPHPLRRIKNCLLRLVTMHQLASHGDHLFEHPLDTPVEPVTDWPQQEFNYGEQRL